MNTAHHIAVWVVIAALSGCATLPGDKILSLQNVAVTADQEQVISQARERVATLLASLELPKDRKTTFEAIKPTGFIREEAALNVGHVLDQLVIAKGDVKIAFAVNSIIIAGGTTHISHSGNNIVISTGDVDISHDGTLSSLVSGFGGRGDGSLVVSKGRIEIAHATKTIVYAVQGVKISHAKGVQSINTADRKVSWGHINNIVIKLLFSDETRSR